MKQTAGQEQGKVTELILEDWQGPVLTEQDRLALESFQKLVLISFNGCGLRSLKEFPTALPLLQLDLSNNELSEDLEPLAQFPSLWYVSIESNRIESYAALAPLKKLPNLTHLDLEGNPLAHESDYRDTVFSILEHLQYLDQKDVKGEEPAVLVADDSGEGSFREDEDDEYQQEEESEEEEEEEEEEYSQEEFEKKKRLRDSSAGHRVRKKLREPESD